MSNSQQTISAKRAHEIHILALDFVAAYNIDDTTTQERVLAEITEHELGTFLDAFATMVLHVADHHHPGGVPGVVVELRQILEDLSPK